MKNLAAISFSDITLEYLRILAINLVILLINIKKMETQSAVLIKHFYLSPTP